MKSMYVKNSRWRGECRLFWGFRRLVKRNVMQKENACQEIYKKITFNSFILTGFDENE